jgi:hypothetical protein
MVMSLRFRDTWFRDLAAARARNRALLDEQYAAIDQEIGSRLDEWDRIPQQTTPLLDRLPGGDVL